MLPLQRSSAEALDDAPLPVAYLLTGLPCAGKTTWSTAPERAHLHRIAVDERVAERIHPLSFSEAGSLSEVFQLVRDEAYLELVEVLRSGLSVVLDLGLFDVAQRLEVKALVEAAGGVWELLYFPVEPDVLRSRLAARNAAGGVNAFPWTETALSAVIEEFKPPLGEGEVLVYS